MFLDNPGLLNKTYFPDEILYKIGIDARMYRKECGRQILSFEYVKKIDIDILNKIWEENIVNSKKYSGLLKKYKTNKIDFFKNKIRYECINKQNCIDDLYYSFPDNPGPFNRTYLPYGTLYKIGIDARMYRKECGGQVLPFEYVKKIDINILNKIWKKNVIDDINYSKLLYNLHNELFD